MFVWHHSEMGCLGYVGAKVFALEGLAFQLMHTPRISPMSVIHPQIVLIIQLVHTLGSFQF